MAERNMRVLVTGGAGILAGYLAETAKIEHELALAVHRREIVCPGVDVRRADLSDGGAAESLVADFKPDWTVHAAGIGNVDYCQHNSDEARTANITATENVIRACRKRGCRLLYTSTNAVYDGMRPPYQESSIRNPVNEYGRQKTECEELVRASGLKHAIVRPILMYGWSRPWSRKDFVLWILESLSLGQAVKLVNDVRENPLAAEECARTIWRLMETGFNGELNIAGLEVVNRYQLGLAAARAFGLDAGLISPVPNSYFKSIAPRPANTSFDTTRMESMGIIPVGLEQGLARMRETRPPDMSQLERGRLNR
ncbi:MAG: NAD(P)-dependent oxidoreductase [Candidatus Edwardsbacteria bacterium]|nr:NAD(P)-dependent oxidoreductase [Candidatus Edwardsbacteria bacterium]